MAKGTSEYSTPTCPQEFTLSFQSANERQCFAGIAPVKEASGNSQWVHMRWACPKFMRQSFHEWAACSSLLAFGPKPIMTSCDSVTSHITVLSAQSRLNGCAFCTAVGETAGHTGRMFIWPVWPDAVFHSHHSSSLCQCLEGFCSDCEYLRSFPLDGTAQVSFCSRPNATQQRLNAFFRKRCVV
ncbi:MAG: transposase [Acidobacteriaceae bacterium]|nr:transposase [Acidobacteriaceae bacterium]